MREKKPRRTLETDPEDAAWTNLFECADIYCDLLKANDNIFNKDVAKANLISATLAIKKKFKISSRKNP